MCEAGKRIVCPMHLDGTPMRDRMMRKDRDMQLGEEIRQRLLAAADRPVPHADLDAEGARRMLREAAETIFYFQIMNEKLVAMLVEKAEMTPPPPFVIESIAG